MDTPCATIPASETHTHTVIFLHGRGDNANQFASSITWSGDSHDFSLIENYPSFRWVFPTAPITDCAASSERRSQWFDVWNIHDRTDCENLQADGLRKSVGKIRCILVNEARRLGWRWDRVILAGISQGAALGVHTLLNLDLNHPDIPADFTQPQRLGAFLGFSCVMPFPGRNMAETRACLGLDGVPDNYDAIQNTPVLLEHCKDDVVARIEKGYALRDLLRNWGVEVTWKEYSDGGHWFHSPTGMDDVRQFLSKTLAVGTPRTVDRQSGMGMTPWEE